MLYFTFIQIVLDEKKIKYLSIQGDDKTDIEIVVNRFNDDPQIQILLLSTTKGGCGLSLVAASWIWLIDLDWNPANDKQAMARIWRLGQKKYSHVMMLLAWGKIDDDIFQVQAKKNLMNSMVMGEVIPMVSPLLMSDEVDRDVNIGPGKNKKSRISESN